MASFRRFLQGFIRPVSWIVFFQAGVAKPGQRRRAQDPVPQGFVGSNPTPRTIDGTPRVTADPIILQHGCWLKKEGYKESTIERRVRILKQLAKHADLKD